MKPINFSHQVVLSYPQTEGSVNGKPTIDDHSDRVYRQLKVFIPAGWDHTQLFRDLRVQKGRNHLPAFPSVVAGGFVEASSLKQAI